MILKILQRLYICSYGEAMNYSTIRKVREARYLSKIISKGQQKKRLQNNQFPSRSSSSSYIKETLSKKNINRMSALNKIFMKHITEILETSQYAEELNKYGIEVRKVMITSDYNFMNIFWIHTRKIDEFKANQILLKTAGLLRYELSVLKIIGHVPEIHFVKDAEQLRNNELDKIFHQLAKVSEKYNRLNIKENDDTAIEREQIDCNRNENLNEFPVMSLNIFGLDHANILKKILLNKTQSEVEKSRPSELHNIKQDKNSSNTWQFDKKLLSKIIFKNKYLQKKMLLQEKKAATFIYDLKEHNSNEESDIENEYNEYESEESDTEDEYCEDESKESKDA